MVRQSLERVEELEGKVEELEQAIEDLKENAGNGMTVEEGNEIKERMEELEGLGDKIEELEGKVSDAVERVEQLEEQAEG